MKSADEILEAALQQPEEERARIAEALYRSLPPEEDADPADVEAAWDDELKRRIDEIDRGEVEMISMEEFEEHIRAWRAAKAARKSG